MKLHSIFQDSRPEVFKNNNLPYLIEKTSFAENKIIELPKNIALGRVFTYLKKRSQQIKIDEKNEDKPLYALKFKTNWIKQIFFYQNILLGITFSPTSKTQLYVGLQSLSFKGEETYAKHFISGTENHFYAQLIDRKYDGNFMTSPNYSTGGEGPMKRDSEKAETMIYFWEKYQKKYPLNKLFHINSLENFFK